jgi:pimeloyl-ACP methyl ester carboxylesterase
MAQAKQISALGQRDKLEVNDIRLRVGEVGSGHALVVLTRGEEAQADALANGLAARNRVIAIDVAGGGAMTAQDLTRDVSQALVGMGLDRFSVLGVSRGAPIALALSIFTPKQIDKLILLSPPPLAVLNEELRAGLPKIEAPTLVLVGTRDRSGSVESARVLRGKIAACHLLLVYEASEAIIAERPEACLSPIGEFLDRGPEFVVCHESQIIRP